MESLAILCEVMLCIHMWQLKEQNHLFARLASAVCSFKSLPLTSFTTCVLFAVDTDSAFFTRQQILLQRILAIAILSVCLSVRPSVCLSITRVDQSKTVQARIAKFSSLAALKTLLSGSVKFCYKFEKGHPERGCKMRGGRKNLRFSADTALAERNRSRVLVSTSKTL